DTLPSEHTLLPRDYRELILKLGYKSERGTEFRHESAETYDPETGQTFDADSDFAEVNRIALRNLSAWVPALNIYKCKRRSGRGASYDAVAIWRESHSGRPLEQRSANLRVHPKGIVDFGDGNKGYSAVDLVMATRNCTNHEALCWLQEKLLP